MLTMPINRQDADSISILGSVHTGILNKGNFDILSLETLEGLVKQSLVFSTS